MDSEEDYTEELLIARHIILWFKSLVCLFPSMIAPYSASFGICKKSILLDIALTNDVYNGDYFHDLSIDIWVLIRFFLMLWCLAKFIFCPRTSIVLITTIFTIWWFLMNETPILFKYMNYMMVKTMIKIQDEKLFRFSLGTKKVDESVRAPTLNNVQFITKLRNVYTYQSGVSEGIGEHDRLDKDTTEVVSTETIGSNLNSITDATVTKVSYKQIKPLPSVLNTIANDGLTMDIVSFLQKPVPFLTGVWANTDGPTTFSNYPWTAPLFASPLYEKMQGILGIKATLVLTLVANPNRFQQGRVILAFCPDGGMGSGTATTEWLRQHRYSRVQVTQLPRVDFDIGTDTQVQLKVPWMSSMPYVPFVNGATKAIGDPGYFFLYPYNAILSASGSTECTFTLYTHYEDIEIVGHTVPQSGWYPQGRGIKSKGKDIMNSETLSRGPVEKGLRVLTDVAVACSTVPLLSSIATPASWLLDAMHGTAAWFGWSKPIAAKGIERYVENPYAYMTNVDMTDCSQPMSLKADNHVGVLPGFAGSDLDEMTIDYIKAIPAWTRTFFYNTTDAVGAELWSTDVFPGAFSNTIADSAPNNLVCRGPMSWLSDYFAYYSGSVNIHIKVVKTEFHSGRLLFVFAPSESLSSATLPAYAATHQGYYHRELFDIRKGNEITINIPFISLMNWRPTTGTGASYGKFYVLVQDKLTAPATVSSVISFNVEVSAGKDMQFSVPKGVGYVPVVPASYQSGWKPQAGGAEGTMVAETIGGTTEETKLLEINQACVGEAVPSLSYLLKRSTPMVLTAITSSTRNIICPFGYSVTRSTGAGTYTVPDGAGASLDFYSHLCQIYCLSRGGVRIRYLPISPSVAGTLSDATVVVGLLPIVSGLSQNSLTIRDSPTASTYNTSISHANVSYSYTRNGVSFQIPQYHFLHARPSAAECLTTSVNYGTNKLCCNLTVSVYNNPTSMTYLIYRSGADDCTFGGFVSIPPYK